MHICILYSVYYVNLFGKYKFCAAAVQMALNTNRYAGIYVLHFSWNLRPSKGVKLVVENDTHKSNKENKCVPFWFFPSSNKKAGETNFHVAGFSIEFNIENWAYGCNFRLALPTTNLYGTEVIHKFWQRNRPISAISCHWIERFYWRCIVQSVVF